MNGGAARRGPRPPTRPSGSAAPPEQRVGYLIAAGINVVAWYAINVWPGWAIAPFLTPDTPQVLGVVNAAIVTAIVSNLVYLVYDPRWVRALGDLVSAAVALAALVQLWLVFPFAFEDPTPWALVTRTALVVGIGGCGVSILVQLIVLVRVAVALSTPRDHPAAPPVDR